MQNASVPYLEKIYRASTEGDEEICGQQNFHAALELLLSLEIAHTHEHFDGICRIKTHPIIQNLIRMDDIAGKGLRSILLAKEFDHVENYLESQDQSEIPSSVLESDELTTAWLKCLGSVLVESSDSSIQRRFLFGDAHVSQLRSRNSRLIDGILKTATLLKKLASCNEQNQKEQLLHQALESTRVSKQPPATSFRIIQPPVRDFQGRQKLLKTINKALKCRCSSSEHDWLGHTVALVGFGGMGKSELARKFVQNYNKKFRNVAWINAETNKTMTRSFTVLAEVLQLARDDHSGDNNGIEMARQIFRHLGQKIPSSLLIYDNAQRLKSMAGEFGIFEYCRFMDVPTET